MQTQKTNHFKTAFLLSFLFSAIGAMMKITHTDGYNIFLVLGILATILFMAIGIYEVNKSAKIGNSEKVMWTIAFLVLNFLAGLLYLISGRRRIA